MSFFTIYWIGGLIWAFLTLLGFEAMRKTENKTPEMITTIEKINYVESKISTVGMIALIILSWPLSIIVMVKSVLSK